MATFRTPQSLLGGLDKRSGRERRQAAREHGRGAGEVDAATAADLGVRELCHDLRQPISAILMLAELVVDEPGMTPASRRRLALVIQEAELLRDFVEQFLTRRSRSRAVDLGRLTRSVVDLATATSTGSIELVVRGRVVVDGDATLLHRALLNVVDNACRVAGGGAVQVQVMARGATAFVQVDDSGPPEGSAVGHGLGLGLQISTAIVEAHGGSIVSGRSDLGGLRMVFALPLDGPVTEPS